MDREAFDQHYDAAYPRLVAAIAFLSNDAELAADAVDEAFARAWEHLRRGGRIESLSAWTRVVAVNYVRGSFRRRRVERSALVRRLFAPAPVELRDIAVSVDVQRALASLPARQREVTVLHYFLDLSISTIATELRIEPGTVKACLHLARKRLAKTLHDRSDAEVPHGV